MDRKYAIDTVWFREQLRRCGKTADGLAVFMGRHKTIVSRMLSGHRKMTAQEQDMIAAYLGVSIDIVAAHRGEAVLSGFSESGQASYAAGDGGETVPKETGRDPYRHPIFGCMAGTITVAPGVDLTEPLDFEWSGKLHHE